MPTPPQERIPGARRALALLLAINLFNYIDRYILAAVEPEIRNAFFAPDDPQRMAKTGSLATAFLVSYMITAPVFGWLADRLSRWWIIGAGVALWSFASAGSGLAATFGMLLATRALVGVGEAGYGPAAPTIIADLFPINIRGRMLSYFYLAIPVGSALGYALGQAVNAKLGWRWPFYLAAPPGVLLAVLCFFMREPRREKLKEENRQSKFSQYATLFRTPSYVLNTLAMAAMTFAIGGLSFWVPAYLEFRGQPDSGRIVFGGITVVAGLVATLLGGLAGDWLRTKVRGAYFVVSGVAILIAFPLSLLMLYTPFPWAWVMMFFAVFFLFFNTGPSNTALANVTHPSVRATAFALNILIIHALGDALSPPLIGALGDRWNMNVAFMAVSATMAIAGVFWLIGARFLDQDTAAISTAVA